MIIDDHPSHPNFPIGFPKLSSNPTPAAFTMFVKFDLMITYLPITRGLCVVKVAVFPSTLHVKLDTNICEIWTELVFVSVFHSSKSVPLRVFGIGSLNSTIIVPDVAFAVAL